MIIIDASVANKIVLEEEGQDKVEEIFRKHTLKIEEIIAVDLLFYEIANTLATKANLSSNKVIRALTSFYQTNLNIYRCGEAEVKEAAKLAKKYKTSVYDMLYAVVAKAHKTILLTADEQFVKQTNFKFVKLL